MRRQPKDLQSQAAPPDTAADPVPVPIRAAAGPPGERPLSLALGRWRGDGMPGGGGGR